ncbi:MAG: hypothetical protein JO168_06000 [Solirubrobacterales bacterium]|nr:hypothetical protein [Solirubrobacterales bacterium]MBV9714157.1 hypothetical protein [Solirubrobacterales bacterium]
MHDELTGLGWVVLIADAQKVKGLARLAYKTDKVDVRALAELSWRDLEGDGSGWSGQDDWEWLA